MTELERRALLGCWDAQMDCTRQGIALPCPFCGAKVKIVNRTFISVPRPVYEETDRIRDNILCGSVVQHPKSDCILSKMKTHLSDWNTRPAPPTVIGGEHK